MKIRCSNEAGLQGKPYSNEEVDIAVWDKDICNMRYHKLFSSKNSIEKEWVLSSLELFWAFEYDSLSWAVKKKKKQKLVV